MKLRQLAQYWDYPCSAKPGLESNPSNRSKNQFTLTNGQMIYL